MAPTANVPLQLEEFFLSKLHVDWVPLPSEGEFLVKFLNLRLAYELATNVQNKHAYQMTLSIAGEDVCENAPGSGFKFDAVIVGQYRLENATPEQEALLARINGVSLLYSTFRGIIGATTGTFQHGRLVLPSIDPRAIVEQVEKGKLDKELPLLAGNQPVLAAPSVSAQTP